jgi:hypothetical protein
VPKVRRIAKIRGSRPSSESSSTQPKPATLRRARLWVARYRREQEASPRLTPEAFAARNGGVTARTLRRYLDMVDG